MSAYQPASNDGAGTGGQFETFDLTVHLGPDAIPWLSATSRVGFVNGIPRRASSVPQLPELLDLVYDYTDAVQFAELQPDPELAGILGDLVFGEPTVLHLFQATRGVAADRGRQLLFRILASPHLAVLPWELLPDPTAQSGSGHRYLALAPDAHLVRLARGRIYPVRTALLEPPLNLLIVLASPTPQDESEEGLAFDIFEVKRGLLSELSWLEQAGMLNIDVEVRPTLDNLRRRIGARQRGYHLFHYVGHALPDRVILEDRTSRRQDLGSSQFVEILRLCPDLRLAVFAGCETARAAGDPATLDPREAVGWRSLLSLADYCVQEACPTVIGMQTVLPFSTERVFTRFFYQALANGYSTAEALRLARGAIQGDERLGGDLLDWSVPALFVGSSEPGPLVPRSAPAPKSVARQRWDLKLGLRQSDERFLARELPLRQAVDIMAGLAPERVLVITGAPGVGKTSLVDRALEELGEAATHVLYVQFDRLTPTIVQACARLDTGMMPDLVELTGLAPDHVLEHLCRLVTELLRYSQTATRARDATWSVGEWWERLVEDLVQHRFVLAIDDIDLLDRVQYRLLEKLTERWLVERAASGPQSASEESWLDVLEQLLAQLQRSQEQGENSSQSMPEPLASELTKLEDYLGGLPDRLRIESRQILGDLLERQVAPLSTGNIASLSDTIDSKDVITALKAMDAVHKSLGEALRILADRRSFARIVITAVDKPWHLLDLPADQVFEMRLAQLTWPEMWRWIRRNLPALLSYGEVYLSRLWSYLGTQLERWEELERRVLRERGTTMDLVWFAKQIAVRSAARPAGLMARRGERALRIAVAGPYLVGPQAVAEAITRLAVEHGIGGRALVDTDEAGTLATLIDEPSPFADTSKRLDPQIMEEWLNRVLAKQPDIVMLDYGAQHPLKGFTESHSKSPEHILLRSMHYRSLLIAAGGNTRQDSSIVSTPSVYPEVLGVGPLDDHGQLRPYAEWHSHLKKPDLFMADDLSTSALGAAIKPNALLFHKQQRAWGSSFSALHAVATATLVWSILPELSPRDIRALLLKASKSIVGKEPAASLTMADAVALARRRVVERTLEGGPASLQTLVAITGLNQQVALATINSLIVQERVVKLTSGRLERFQLIGPNYP